MCPQADLIFFARPAICAGKKCRFNSQSAQRISEMFVGCILFPISHVRKNARREKKRRETPLNCTEDYKACDSTNLFKLSLFFIKKPLWSHIQQVWNKMILHVKTEIDLFSYLYLCWIPYPYPLSPQALICRSPLPRTTKAWFEVPNYCCDTYLPLPSSIPGAKTPLGTVGWAVVVTLLCPPLLASPGMGLGDGSFDFFRLGLLVRKSTI